MTTTLLDAHVYVFRRAVLDLMMTREPKDLESVREDLVPWLVKGGWQEGLREKWSSSGSDRCQGSIHADIHRQS